MKNILKDTNALATLVWAAILVIALIGGYFAFAGDGFLEAPEEAAVVDGQALSGTFTLSLTNLTGNGVGTDADVTVYLTAPDFYEDYYGIYASIDEEGSPVSPYDSTQVAGAKTATPSSNDVTFAVVGTEYDSLDPIAYPGTDFGVAIIDSGTTSISDYSPLFGKIKFDIHYSLDEDKIDDVIEGLDGYLGSTIELAPRGDLNFYDSQSGTGDRTGYTLGPTHGVAVEDADFELTVRLTHNNAALEDVGIYILEQDNWANTSNTTAVTLDDVEVWVNGAKISGTSLTKVVDLDSASGQRKNAPAETGTGTETRWYVEGGEFDIARTNANNLDTVTIKIVDFDYSTDCSTDEARIIVQLVPFVVHKDSDMTNSSFIIQMLEGATTGYN